MLSNVAETTLHSKIFLTVVVKCLVCVTASTSIAAQLKHNVWQCQAVMSTCHLNRCRMHFFIFFIPWATNQFMSTVRFFDMQHTHVQIIKLTQSGCRLITDQNAGMSMHCIHRAFWWHSDYAFDDLIESRRPYGGILIMLYAAWCRYSAFALAMILSFASVIPIVSICRLAQCATSSPAPSL